MLKQLESIFLLVVAVVLIVVMMGAPSYAESVAFRPEALLKQAFPQVQFDSIESFGVTGLYEVVSGNNIFYFYFSPEKQFILAGDIYSSQGKNLTADKRSEISAKLIKTLPLEKAVKIGNGKKTVVEFTDPDCPYCKKVSEFFKDRTDITRYVFFAPLAHPQAMPKIQYILAAEDKEKAYKQMMLGTSQPAVNGNFPESIKALAEEHLNLARKVGVQGTPTMYIEGKPVVGADIPLIEKLLKE